MEIKKHTRHVLRMVIVCFAVLGAIWLNTQFASEAVLLNHIRSFGYLGLFLVSIVSGFNVLVPVPIIAFFPTLVSAGFDPFSTVGVIALGMTVGDALGYLIGSTAQDTSMAQRVSTQVEKIEKKHPLLLPLVIFLYGALVPLPNELIIIPLSALRVSFYRIFIPIMFGNILFNTLVATGVAGIVQVL
jgi:membrane protein YqaA with SNARE-associated domain